MSLKCKPGLVSWESVHPAAVESSQLPVDFGGIKRVDELCLLGGYPDGSVFLHSPGLCCQAHVPREGVRTAGVEEGEARCVGSDGWG